MRRFDWALYHHVLGEWRRLEAAGLAGHYIASGYARELFSLRCELEVWA